MDDFVKECIEDIYIRKNYKSFISKCKQCPFYLSELIDVSKDICKSINVYNTRDDPKIEILFEFDKFIKDSLCVEYVTVLKISKVSDLFVFQHEFSVDNKDPKRMDPVLTGFSQQAYTFSQSVLENSISDFLEKHKLYKLQLSEMDEVVCNVPIPNDIVIFGNQMTVENALFRDLYELCVE